MSGGKPDCHLLQNKKRGKTLQNNLPESCACRKIKLVKPSTWSSKEILGMKREALLDCFGTMKACYGKPWARTSVDLAIEVDLHSVLAELHLCKLMKLPHLLPLTHGSRLVSRSLLI